MSGKASSITENTEKRRKDGGKDEVLLRDESDEIIDTLKTQLKSLQNQLAHTRRTNEKSPPQELRSRFQAELTPHIASRLQMPAEELTQRLERLITQVEEPEIRDELEQCRDTAYFLFDTFRRISEKHEVLTDSLTAEVHTVGSEQFRRLLDDALRERGLAVSLLHREPMPETLTLSQQSVLTVLITLSGLAVEMFGPGVTLELSSLSRGDALRLVIRGEGSIEGLHKGDPLSSAAIRTGLRSAAVVDLLYVEKIVEMRGGMLGFFRRGDRTQGFELTLPISPPLETADLDKPVPAAGR
ncbi:MAG: hypothetical protein OEW39_04850 [Deltaproteobacteria bacterium]|nr:hypothetical protein [Deltaproteobacteria bacterium]